MLLIHHAILNSRSHRCHWTEYLPPLHHFPGLQANVVIAAHSVWLMAFLPLVDRYKFQQYDYDWFGEGSPEELGKVNNILGMPRKLLHLQHQIRSCAKYGKRADDLLKEISCMRALLEGSYTQEVMVIAARTVKSYQLATSLYAYARLFWSVPLPHRLPLSNSAVVYLHVTHEFSRRPRSS